MYEILISNTWQVRDVWMSQRRNTISNQDQDYLNYQKAQRMQASLNLHSKVLAQSSGPKTFSEFGFKGER